MAERSAQYKWSDAWLLLAVVYAAGGGDATLDRIIGAGDFINHAIFNQEELESGFSRLTAGGYIEEKDGSFRATAKVIESYRMTTTPRRTVFKEVEDMRQLLGAASWTAIDPLPDPENNLNYHGFSSQLYEEAVSKYVARTKSK